MKPALLLAAALVVFCGESWAKTTKKVNQPAHKHPKEATSTSTTVSKSTLVVTILRTRDSDHSTTKTRKLSTLFVTRKARVTFAPDPGEPLATGDSGADDISSSKPSETRATSVTRKAEAMSAKSTGNADKTTNKSSHGLSGGAQAGIGVGVAVGALFIIVCGWLLFRRRGSRQSEIEHAGAVGSLPAGYFQPPVGELHGTGMEEGKAGWGHGGPNPGSKPAFPAELQSGSNTSLAFANTRPRAELEATERPSTSTVRVSGERSATASPALSPHSSQITPATSPPQDMCTFMTRQDELEVEQLRMIDQRRFKTDQGQPARVRRTPSPLEAGTRGDDEG